MTTLEQHFRRLRAPRFSPYGARKMFVMTARSALSGARMAMREDEIERRFREAGGEIVSQHEADWRAEWCGSRVRILEIADERCDVEDRLWETFTPECHPEIKPEILAREREREIERIDRDGVWGYIAQAHDGHEWQDVDSIWGFIGDDFKGSGYDTDLMSAALDAVDAALIHEAEELEATRPDMYEAA